MDRLLLDIIDNKRKSEEDRYLREPGHIEYASRLGLGVYDIKKIQVRRIEL